MCGSVDQDGGSLWQTLASRGAERLNRLGLGGVLRMTLVAEVFGGTLSLVVPSSSATPSSLVSPLSRATPSSSATPLSLATASSLAAPSSSATPLSSATFSSSVMPSSWSTPSSLDGGARFWSRELGLGGLVSSRLVSSRLVSGAEVDSSIYTGNWVVV